MKGAKGAPKKLLVLSRYSRLGASSRLRTMQYAPWLEHAGFEVTYAPLFDDAYLQGLYDGARKLGNLSSYYRNRFAALSTRPSPDLIWVEKEALPWLPWLVERRAFPKGVEIVSDHDDAVFHRYDQHRLATVRWLYGKKIDRVMQNSALVTAGNDYLAARARASCANNVEVVPTVVDLEHYPMSELQQGRQTAHIGWIGSPSTWTDYMAPMMPSLVSIAQTQDARLMAVGAGKAADPHILLDNLPWSEETEALRISEMDIGIMPLADTQWARGKCGYKLIQYMASGLPVIASPVGVNTEIVEHGVNGFLAATQDEWREALVALLREPALRRKMGQAGRRKVEQHYSLQIWGPKVAQMLSQVVTDQRA
jgi:glycosyltransferase involved in cell wall biosynthesis